MINERVGVSGMCSVFITARICVEHKPKFHLPVQAHMIKATQPFEKLNVDFKGPLIPNNPNPLLLNIVNECSHSRLRSHPRMSMHANGVFWRPILCGHLERMPCHSRMTLVVCFGDLAGINFCLMSVWDRRKEILYGNGLVVEVSQNNPTPECEVNGTECYDGWVWVFYLLEAWCLTDEIRYLWWFQKYAYILPLSSPPDGHTGPFRS